MKKNKALAEERANLLTQAQNLYKQKYKKFPQEDGYKLSHTDKNEIIFASSEESMNAYIKHKSRDKRFLKATFYLVIIETMILYVSSCLYKHEFIHQYILGIIIFLIVWVGILSGIAVQQHNKENDDLRMIYQKHVVSVKLRQQKIKFK